MRLRQPPLSSGVRPRVKSLGEFGRTDECEQIRDLLASRGIPTYLSTGFKASRGALFVCINEQYEDALAVLKNPEHVVANPVDVSEFEREALEVFRMRRQLGLEHVAHALRRHQVLDAREQLFGGERLR